MTLPQVRDAVYDQVEALYLAMVLKKPMEKSEKPQNCRHSSQGPVCQNEKTGTG
ncbi:MAG: hypothetical protein R2874_16875 [Desulfobacterales bacterium]